jgi:hypothetical protein
VTSIKDRMIEIERLADEGATYYQRLIRNCGSLQSAAMVDLAIDGDLWSLDLRRSPFAGDEDLKEVARAAVEAQRTLRDELFTIVWKEHEA